MNSPLALSDASGSHNKSAVRILLCNWRDSFHHKAGGAEAQTHVLARGLAARGHAVTVATSFGRNSVSHRQRTDGYTTLRFGNELTCRLHIGSWLSRHNNYYDVVIDEVNTLPFLSPLIAPKKTLLWIHQLAREVWLAEAPFPANYLGYVSEPLLMRIYRNTPLITGAKSTEQSLKSFGFRGRIDVIEYALDPPHPLAFSPEEGSVGYVGRLVPSKRVDHIIRAVKLASAEVPSIKLYVVGSGPDRERVRLERLTRDLGVSERVVFEGRLSNSDRDDRMKRLDVLSMTSVREGWGLVIAEAARFSVPSVVYPVAGLVDAVLHDVSGIVTPTQTPEAIANALKQIITNRARRADLGEGARKRLTDYTEKRFVDLFESRILEHNNSSRNESSKA